MTTINLEANVKNLVTSSGLSLSSSGNSVTLSLNNSGLAQILSQILQSSSSVTVNYAPTTGTITFTSSQGSGTPETSIPPLIITNKDQFNSQRQISVGLNQNVFLLATNSGDWEDNTTYYLVYPNSFDGLHYSWIVTDISISSSMSVNFTALNLPGSNNPSLKTFNAESKLFYVVGNSSNLGMFESMSRAINN